MRTRVRALNASLSTSESLTRWEILREVAHSALWTVATIVRSASLCSGVAWLAILCFNQGNLLAFQLVREQSYTSSVLKL